MEVWHDYHSVKIAAKVSKGSEIFAGMTRMIHFRFPIPREEKR